MSPSHPRLLIGSGGPVAPGVASRRGATGLVPTRCWPDPARPAGRLAHLRGPHTCFASLISSNTHLAVSPKRRLFAGWESFSTFAVTLWSRKRWLRIIAFFFFFHLRADWTITDRTGNRRFNTIVLVIGFHIICFSCFLKKNKKM